MPDQDDAPVPKAVSDFNERIVKLLKEVDSKDFVTVLSHPARLVRVAADDQQQQQQQQHRAL
jgi:hypothetical protein